MTLPLSELYKRNLGRGMVPFQAMQSALAEQGRVESGQTPEEAEGTRKVRKQRRKDAAGRRSVAQSD